MPLSDEHLERARANERFAESLDFSLEVDFAWAITALFYSALHYVDAYCVKFIHKPINHDDRERIMDDNGFLSEILKPYMALQHASKQARYHLAPLGRVELERAKRLHALIRGKLESKLQAR